MPRRVWAAVALPIGLAACERELAAPEPAPAATVNPIARMHLSPERRQALDAAVADVRLRLLPSIDAEPAEDSPLASALRRLEDALAREDGTALIAAAAAAEAALTRAAGDEEALAVEADAVRLLLDELRESAGRGGREVLED